MKSLFMFYLARIAGQIMPAVATFEKHASMLGKTAAEAPESYRQTSPLTCIRSNSPPFLILHGTADKTVGIELSRCLTAALPAAGVKYESITVPSVLHRFNLQPAQIDLRPVVVGF